MAIPLQTPKICPFAIWSEFHEIVEIFTIHEKNQLCWIFIRIFVLWKYVSSIFILVLVNLKSMPFALKRFFCNFKKKSIFFLILKYHD